MTCVVVESPYAGDVERNVKYARLCMLDCLQRGEAPYASHLLYTQCLDDDTPDERTLGILAGFAWGAKADLHAFYVDLGVSDGMRKSLANLGDAPRDMRMLPTKLMEKMND